MRAMARRHDATKLSTLLTRPKRSPTMCTTTSPLILVCPCMYHLTNPLHFFMIASSFRRRELGLVFRPIMRSSYNIMVGVDFIRLGLRRILDSIFGDFRVCIFLSLYNPKRLGEDQEGPLRFRKEHTKCSTDFLRLYISFNS